MVVVVGEKVGDRKEGRKEGRRVDLTVFVFSPCASYSSTALTRSGQERRKRPELKEVLEGWKTKA